MADRWILSRLHATIATVADGIEGYSFGTSISAIYDFAWHDFCDWYLESIKSRMQDGDRAARSVALYVLDTLLRVLHPFMPFISEELWHRLPGERDFLVRTAWPEADERFADPDAEERMQRMQALVEEIRSARKAARAAVRGGWLAFDEPHPEEEAELIATLADVEVVPELEPAGAALSVASARIAFPAAKASDAGRERERERLRKELARTVERLSNQEFVAKAPAPVVEKERAREAELNAALARLT
jgi:valyl-tRNA synthetase